jgi:hypothetical protein
VYVPGAVEPSGEKFHFNGNTSPLPADGDDPLNNDMYPGSWKPPDIGDEARTPGALYEYAEMY